MSRRGRRDRGTTRVAGLLLPPDALTYAENTINSLARRTVAECAALDMTRDEVVGAIFDPDDIALLTKAKAISIENISSYHNWHLVQGGCTATLRVMEWGCFPPARVIMQPTAAKMLAHIGAVGEIIKQFSVVNSVLQLLQMNTTPSTCRSVWPCIAGLVGRNYADLFNVAERPAYGLQQYAPLLRASMGTLASASLLPAPRPENDNCSFEMTYKAEKFMFCGEEIKPISLTLRFN